MRPRHFPLGFRRSRRWENGIRLSQAGRLIDLERKHALIGKRSVRRRQVESKLMVVT